MKIAICDDSIEDLIKIEKLLQQYVSSSPTPDFQIEKYSNPSKLCKQIQQKQLADVYLLDIMMEDNSGIDIGRQLRKTGSEPIIIYITSSDDFALDAYHVHAARYLLKPVQKTDLFEALDYSFSHMGSQNGPVYLVKTKMGLITVPFFKIEYIENVSRTLDVHLADGEIFKSIFIRKSFDEEIKELLSDKSFLHVHKSFIVNLRYVRKLTSNSIIMESGKNIPVSKTRTSDVKKEYLLFVSEQYR